MTMTHSLTRNIFHPFLKISIKKRFFVPVSASMARGRGVSRLWGGEVFVCWCELLWLLVWRMSRARYRSVSPWRRDNMTPHHRHQPIITIRSGGDTLRYPEEDVFVYPGIDRVITIIHDTLRHWGPMIDAGIGLSVPGHLVWIIEARRPEWHTPWLMDCYW